MNRLLLCLAVAAPLAARADSLEVVGSAGFDLSTLTVADSQSAELKVGERVIEARYGLRLAGTEQQFAPSHPVVIGREFLVKDQKGNELRFWVRAVAGAKKWVELLPPSSGADPLAHLEGVYGVVAVKEGGSDKPADGYPELRLAQDGSFRVGRAVGRFSAVDRVLLLSGFDAWGRGELAADGKAITFRFRRQGADVELRLSRQDELTAARP